MAQQTTLLGSSFGVAVLLATLGQWSCTSKDDNEGDEGGALMGAMGGAGGAGGAPSPPARCGGDDLPACRVVTLEADIAECFDSTSSDPASCEAINGEGQIAVDSYDLETGGEQWGYLRFQIPDRVSIPLLERATLELRATDDPDADGPMSGVVWLVEAFSDASLNPRPRVIGTAPIAYDQGKVTQDQAVTWPLPPRSVAVGGYHLGIEPSHNDGLLYYNARSPHPPRLHLELVPE